MRRHGRARGISKLAIIVPLLLAACAPRTLQLHEELRSVESGLASPEELDNNNVATAVRFDGSLKGYLSYAYAHSPALRASFERWRAATFRPEQESRLPEPTVSYAVFLRSVETRVGPQRHRFGASQWFPWPTKLSAGRGAATLEAQAAQRAFEGHALAIAADVSVAYWHLWQLQRQREVLRGEIDVLKSLSEQVRGRLSVGAAELSDLAQIDLMTSQAQDKHATLREEERVASIRLVRVLGAPENTETPVDASEPKVAPLAEEPHALSIAAAEHPEVQTLARLSDAARERERQAKADRAPSFGVGVDWVLTGESRANPSSAESGKDAVALSLSLKVPLWSRAYKAAESEARAHASAFRSRAIDARNGVAAQVREHAALVNDAARRVSFFDTTLLPQARTTFESVLASYASSRATVAELLLAEQAVLKLRSERFSAQADFGREVAELERVVGRPVRFSPPPKGNLDDE